MEKRRVVFFDRVVEVFVLNRDPKVQSSTILLPPEQPISASPQTRERLPLTRKTLMFLERLDVRPLEKVSLYERAMGIGGVKIRI